MIQLRKLYRNLLRAEALVVEPTPVYQPPPPPPEAAPEEGNGSADAVAAAAAAEADEAQRLEAAVEVVAEMELTAEQLKAGLRALKACSYDFSRLFREEAGKAAAAELEQRVAALYDELAQRAAVEVSHLPFTSEAAAHAAIDARNARFRLSIPWSPGEPGEGGGGGGVAGSSVDQGDRPPQAPLSERLVKAEKAAEQFVARRLQPAVARVKQTSPEGVVQGLKTSACRRAAWNAPDALPMPAPLLAPLPLRFLLLAAR